MKKILLAVWSVIIFAVFLLAPAAATAETVTVNPITIPNWTAGGTTAKMRIVANDSFFNSNGVQVLRGSFATGAFYKEVVCTIAAGVVSCPSFTIETTTDSSVPTATYSAFLYTSRNIKYAEYLSNFRIPTSFGGAASWAEISAYNKTAARPPTPLFYDADQINRLLDNLITSSTGSVLSVAGRQGAITLTKADVGLPLVANLQPSDYPVSNAQAAALAGKIDLTQKGAANGVAALDINGKIGASIITGLSKGALIGRSADAAGGKGVAEQITVGSGLEIFNGILTATGGGTGGGTTATPTPTPAAPVSVRMNWAATANNAIITASSTVANFGQAGFSFIPVNAADGDRTTNGSFINGGSVFATAKFNEVPKPQYYTADFATVRNIDEINVIGVKDSLNYTTEPTLTETNTKFANVDFKIEYYNSATDTWATVLGGNIVGNNKTWVQLTGLNINTTAMRLALTLNQLPAEPFYIVEFEAIGSATTAVAATKTTGDYVGKFLKANLPAAPDTGAIAQLIDATKGLVRWNGEQWVPLSTGNEINFLDWCNPATTDNCTPALHAIAAYAETIGGVTINNPAGYTFKFATPVNLQGRANLIIKGSASTNFSSFKPEWLYTGAGAQLECANYFPTPNGVSGVYPACDAQGAIPKPAFDLRNDHGIVFRNMRVVYNNPLFTGILIKTGHGSQNNSDSAFLQFVDSFFGGESQQSDNAEALIDMTLSISSSIVNCNFQRAKWGIRGAKGAVRLPADTAQPATYFAQPEYSYVIQVTGSHFKDLDSAIHNPDSNWNVSGNTFEGWEDSLYNPATPNVPPDPRNDTLIAVSHDKTFYSRGFTFTNNYLGDTNSLTQKEAVVQGKFLGATFADNWWTITQIQNAIELFASQGVTVENNRVENATSNSAFPNSGSLVVITGGGGFGISILNNSVNFPNLYTGFASGLTAFGNEIGGNLLTNIMDNGLKLTGNDIQPDATRFSLVLGNTANAAIKGSGAAIRQMLGGTNGHGAGALVLQSDTSAVGSDIDFVTGGDALTQFKVSTTHVDAYRHFYAPSVQLQENQFTNKTCDALSEGTMHYVKAVGAAPGVMKVCMGMGNGVFALRSVTTAP